MSPADRDPTDPHSADASDDGPAGPVSRPHSAAHARREVEFALHPLLCAPDVHFRAAHREGVDNALLVASELIADALTSSTPGAPCELTCTFDRCEVTISVAGPYDTAARPYPPSSPPGLHPGGGKLDGLRQRIVHEIASHVRVTRRTYGGRITTATIQLTGP